MLLIALLYGVGIQRTVVLVPLFLGLGVLTAFALGTWLAALNVKYRDVALVVPVLVQILFFVTPVLYSGHWRSAGAGAMSTRSTRCVR